MSISIRCCGALGEVTGSGYLVSTDRARVLVDFGLFQGRGAGDLRNRDLGPVQPNALDAVILTHAHLDHCGRLPLLAHGRYRGPIYATSATCEFARLLLEDAARLQTADLMRTNRRRQRRNRKPAAPLYTPDDVDRIIPQLTPFPYDQSREIAPGIHARMVDSGHILGSASLALTVKTGEGDGDGTEKTLIFSGDIGPRNSPILRDPVLFDHGDMIFLESTYGNREHKPLDATVQEFQKILINALERKAKVLIPTFAVGRSQQILFHIAELVRSGRVPRFPTYLDSPLAIKATRVYEQHPELFDEETTALLNKGQFQNDLQDLHFTEDVAQSRELNENWEMSVILAGAGMCDGGRILHHFKHNLWKPNVAVIIVGFQAEHSLGRQLVNGAKTVKIHGETIAVRAKIHTLGGFSAHAGQTELADWIDPIARQPRKEAEAPPRVILTHGEPPARTALADAIAKRFGIAAELPEPGTTLML